MERTKVINIKSGQPHDVYIGRANGRYRLKRSIWHNPYKAKEYGLERSLELYRERLLDSPELLERLPELKGKVLACWCAPKPCHGDILAEFADATS